MSLFVFPHDFLNLYAILFISGKQKRRIFEESLQSCCHAMTIHNDHVCYSLKRKRQKIKSIVLYIQCLTRSHDSFLWVIDQVISVIILWKSIQKYSVMPNAIGSHICHNRTWEFKYVKWRNIISKSWPVSLFLIESYLDSWNVQCCEKVFAPSSLKNFFCIFFALEWFRSN